MGSALKVVEENLHEISLEGKQMLFHIPSSSLFQLEGATNDVINAVRAKPELTTPSTIRRTQNTLPNRNTG